LVIACVAAVAVCAASAHGQECVRGERETTAAERETMTRVLQSALAALPQAPEGWVIGGYEAISVVQRLCLDHEARPWEYNVSRTYNRVDDAAEREQFRADAAAALRASQAERQPRIDALYAKSDALSAQLAAAAQAGDQARIDSIYREREQLNRDMEAIMSEGPSLEQLAAIGNQMTQDQLMAISVIVNGVAHTEGLQSAPAPAGAQAAFRGETRGDTPQTNVVLLFGSWQARENGDMQTARRGTLSSAAPHGMALSVRADPARIDSLLAAIDVDAFAALVR
jgi:hypothetical protein